MTEQQNKEEIDLLALLERCIRFFRRFKWVFVVALVAGLSCGYIFYRLLPTVYRSRMVVHSFILTNAEQIQIVNNWGDLLRQKEYGALAKAWNCSEQLVQELKWIRAKEIQQVFTPNNPNGFMVDVRVSDNSFLERIQQALVWGFENNSFVRDKLATRKKGLAALITETENQFRKLDTSRQQTERLISGNGHSSASLIVDASAINRQLVELQEKLQGFRETLEFTAAVQVLQDFIPVKKPDGPHLLTWLALGAISFTCIAWFATVVLNLLSKLKARSAKQ